MPHPLLLDLYPQIRLAHIGLVVLSGSLFAVRGLATFAGARWSGTRAVRHASWMIDTALLAAALLLLYVLQLNPFAVSWLSAKLALLVLYIVFGTMALRRARSNGRRIAWFVAALGCYAMMYSIARAHDPLGILRTWIG